MGWKIPLQYKRRDADAIILQNNHTTRQHPGHRQKEKQINDGLLRRNDVIKLSIEEAKNYEPCPRHGRKYLVKEGGAIYCFAETKGEVFPRCFYHVAFKDDEDLDDESTTPIAS
jgi:hypothetical protein